MRVSPISVNYGTKYLNKIPTHRESNAPIEKPVENVNFKGDWGRFLGGTLGAIVGTAAAAVTGAAVLIPICLYGGARWGHDEEENAKSHKKHPKP